MKVLKKVIRHIVPFILIVICVFSLFECVMGNKQIENNSLAIKKDASNMFLSPSISINIDKVIDNQDVINNAEISQDEPQTSSDEVSSEPQTSSDEMSSEPQTSSDEVSSEPQTSSDEMSSEPQTSSDEVSSEPQTSSDEIQSSKPSTGVSSEKPATSSKPSTGVSSEKPATSSKPSTGVSSENSATSSKPSTGVSSEKPATSSKPSTGMSSENSGGNTTSSEDNSTQTPPSGDISSDDEPTQSEGGVVGDEGENNPDLPGDNPVVETTTTEYFTTTIKNGETVQYSTYSFEIINSTSLLCLSEEEQVLVNNVVQPQFNGRVSLQVGQNVIEIRESYLQSNGKKINAIARYVVYYKSSEITQTYLSTDLSNYPLYIEDNGKKDIEVPDKKVIIVHDEKFTFNAKIVNGTSNGRITSVTINGQKVIATNEQYSVTLKDKSNGDNTIVISLQERNSSNKKFNKKCTFSVRYIPISTEETKPLILQTNIQNGQVFKDERFIFEIMGVSYENASLYDDKIYVTLNDVLYKSEWKEETDTKLKYNFHFKEGQNVIKVRLTDKAGRTETYQYNVTYEKQPIGTVIGHFKFSVDANVLGLGNIVEETELEIKAGESFNTTILNYLASQGFTWNNTGEINDGFYLARLNKAGIGTGVNIPPDLLEALEKEYTVDMNKSDSDSLGEFDYTPGSGWMYTVNGKYQALGIADNIVVDGDIVRLRFTLALGRDIGIGLNGNNYETVY